MPTIELDPREATVLAEVLTDYVSDLRMEVADTDSQEVRDELKAREEFLKDLLLRLAATAEGGRSGGNAR